MPDGSPFLPPSYSSTPDVRVGTSNTAAALLFGILFSLANGLYLLTSVMDPGYVERSSLRAVQKVKLADKLCLVSGSVWVLEMVEIKSVLEYP